MNKRVFLMVTSLGIGLTACGDKEGPGPGQETVNPPPPPPELPDGPELPTDADGDVPADGELPTWDEVESGHPEGATNPPIPELVVTPDGQCFKQWRGAMIPPEPGEVWGDRVEDCESDCGVPIQCPDKAKELLDAYEPPPININPPEPEPADTEPPPMDVNPPEPEPVKPPPPVTRNPPAPQPVEPPPPPE